MSFKDTAFATLAQSVIINLNKRNMEGYYFENSASCIQAIKEMLPADSIIGFGGSMTLSETGMMDQLQSGDYKLIDRSTATTFEEHRELFSRTVMADYYFMSTNAMTYNGELVNIDGNGNRVAALIHGPKHVFLLVGRNKLTASLESAIERVHNVASPANAQRLKRNIPCGLTGQCADCLSPECFCNQVVITRRSGHSGRIHVFLINEDLGY